MVTWILAAVAIPLVVLAARDFRRGMVADDADQFKAAAYVKARTAVVGFAIASVFVASTSATVAVAFMVLGFAFQFAVSDRLLAPAKIN